MKFRGLFIGIDRCADSRIPWLSGAARDASALHALFSDSVGGDLNLLLDEDATAARIRESLAALAASSSEDDVVVVSFAGHGTDDHRLVPFDADPGDITGSCIPLDELADLLSAIPGATLFCALDCCFSGGLGARVFSPELRPRSMPTNVPISVLDRFVGEGRVVLAASADDEEALESPRHGHGLLTFRLLEALQGAEPVLVGGQVSLFKLVEHVIEQVQADARRMGFVQTPGLRGRLEGTPSWPVLVPGDAFEQLFPESRAPRASADLSSLTQFGFDESLLAAWRKDIPQLNDLQLRAINDFGVLNRENIVVTAPTSSGKTMIGELTALHGIPHRRRSIFLLPMRALVNDKFKRFVDVYAPLGVTTIRATGEHSDDVPALLAGHFDIALLTYEKYSALALGYPHLLDLAGTVIVDEAQILADNTRGANLEFLLTLLNNRREQAGSPQIITLSAVVGNIEGLDTWLGARNLHSTTRPVDLVEGVLERNGRLRLLDESGEEGQEDAFVVPLPESGSRSVLIPLVKRIVGEGKKVIVFRQTKGETVASAVYLSRALGLAAADDALERLPDADPSTSSANLRQTMGGGVAFHSTDLNRDERQVIEEEFRSPESSLKVIAATPTLAMGVNTPASAVAIVGLTHPGPAPTPYTVAEYKNMVGRAGRLGLAESGESYLIPEGSLSADRAWNDYVRGDLESLRSKLVPDGDPRSLMLRVLAALPGDATALMSEDDVISFLDSSFAAFQARRDPTLTQWSADGLRQGFRALAQAQLIQADDGGYRLTQLGRFAGESGVHVDSIVRLVRVLRPVTDSLNSVGLIAAAQVTVELDDVYIPANARARNTEVPKWPRLLAQQGVAGALVHALAETAEDMRSAVMRAKRAAAAAMWIAGQPTDAIEVELTRHLRQSGGVAGAIRGASDRTRDLIPAVAAVVHQLNPELDVDSLVERTMVRLELGIPAGIVDLALALNVDLSRAEWLSLNAAGATTVEKVLDLENDELIAVLGSPGAAQRLRRAAESAESDPSPPPMVLPTPTE